MCLPRGAGADDNPNKDHTDARWAAALSSRARRLPKRDARAGGRLRYGGASSPRARPARSGANRATPGGAAKDTRVDGARRLAQADARDARRPGAERSRYSLAQYPRFAAGGAGHSLAQARD